MLLIVILSKEIESQEEGQQLYDIVKAQYVNQPDIKVEGKVNNNCVDTPI